jgi:stage II sporulation protein D
MGSVKHQPTITVGIMDRKTEVSGRLNGNFYGDGSGPVSGRFSTKAVAGMIVFLDEANHQTARSPSIKLTAQEGSTFSLFNVTIGKRFHWERNEDQTFQGDLFFQLREDGTVAVINAIPLEDYLKSVIASEMNPAAPMEFLKTHAILSRSWLLAGLGRKKKTEETSIPTGRITEGEVLRWYDREDHDLFDVCADDHCQRYQGITKIVSKQAEEAVGETQGVVITFQDKICDTRYSKACGGFTEEYDTAWDDKRVPYLRSISDASVSHQPIKTEEEARRWILSEPEAYCNLKDKGLLKKILPGFDRETKNFFRWTVEYSRGELEEIIRKKSGFDFGVLREIIPLQRGPSGRISRLKIVGSKRSMIIGKELEIRNWLSRTHLYSSAFVVAGEANQFTPYNPVSPSLQTGDEGNFKSKEKGKPRPLGKGYTGFTFQGAGWGHGVGLCQIGAAVMGTQGFSAEEILKHYFRGVEIKKIY